MNRHAMQSFGVGCGAALIAVLLWFTGALDRFEFSTWAWRVNAFAPHQTPSPKVKVVLVDQASLDWGAKEMGWSWPWPREVYASMLGFFKRGGAKVVAVDILFTEPSVYGMADDEALGTAFQNGGAVIGAAFYGRNRSALPIPAVSNHAAVVANVSDEPDADGVFRRATLWQSRNGQRIPSLGLAAWANGTGDASGSGCPELPLDEGNRLILRFAGTHGMHETYSAAAIIQSEMRLLAHEHPTVSPSVFSNAYVLVGYGAPGLMDLRPTPVSRIAPGVEIHATVLDNLLTGRLLRDVPMPWALAMTALMACLAAGLVLGAKKPVSNVLAFAAGLATPVCVGFLAYAVGYWWPMFVGLLSVLIAIVGAVLLNYATVGRQKAFIKKAFRFYLGEEVIDQILEDPARLKLGGEKRELTVFFSDIESFSTFSERLDPSALTALLNDYLSDMGAIIKEEGGYLDKYIGDAIVAFWNAPVTQPDHAERACRAAIRCQRRLSERNADIEQRYGVRLRARIGLNTGHAVVGNMGSYERFNYTVLGDAANLASRLEGANKSFGTYVMVSENTWQASGCSFVGRELAVLRVVGRKSPVRVYELCGLPGESRPDEWTSFEEARALFASGLFDEACAVFARTPADPVSRAYAEKCQRLTAKPPLLWEGVWELTEK